MMNGSAKRSQRGSHSQICMGTDTTSIAFDLVATSEMSSVKNCEILESNHCLSRNRHSHADSFQKHRNIALRIIRASKYYKVFNLTTSALPRA